MAAAAGIGVNVAIDLVLALLEHAGEVQQLISTATAEGRTTLTIDEWAGVVGADDAALSSLSAAIAAKKAP